MDILTLTCTTKQMDHLCAFFLAECFPHFSRLFVFHHSRMGRLLGIPKLLSMFPQLCSFGGLHACTHPIPGLRTILRSYHTRTTSKWTMPEAFVRRVISGFLRSARYHEHFLSSAAVDAFHCCQAITGGLLLSLASLSWDSQPRFSLLLLSLCRAPARSSPHTQS